MGNLCVTKKEIVTQLITEDEIKCTKCLNTQSLLKEYDEDDLQKLILIQSFVLMKFIHKKYLQKFNDQASTLLNKLNENKVQNEYDFLSKHPGEQLYSKLLSEGKCESKLTLSCLYQKVVISGLVFAIDKSNDCYIGSWNLDGEYHGYGVLYHNGAKYEGMWCNGKLSGLGRIFHPNGDYFLGHFINGRANGTGLILHHDLSYYEGDWINDQPNGSGKELGKDGSIYEGKFHNGKKLNGKFTWVDGNSYEGEIYDNQLNGQGVFLWKNNKRYEGQWYQNQMTGEGKMSFPDGCSYTGQFNNNLFEGYGKYIWNKNKYYEGDWRKSKQNGKGLYFKDGILIEGIWSMGKLLNSYIKLSTPSNTAQLTSDNNRCE